MQTLTTTGPRERPLSLEWCIHRLTPPSTPTFLPVLSDLPPLADGDIPRGRVHTAAEGDILRVRGQDSGPRRRRPSPTAQKCPRRRRLSPPREKWPHGQEIPTGPVTPASTSQDPVPREPAQATGLTSPHSSIRRTPTADTDNFLHYTSRRRTTQIEPRCRRTPATRRAPPNP